MKTTLRLLLAAATAVRNITALAALLILLACAVDQGPGAHLVVDFGSVR